MSLPLFALVVGAGAFSELIQTTGIVAKVVLVILLLFSIFSWAIILGKWSTLRRARKQSSRFLRAFRKAQRLNDIHTVSDSFRPSPLVAMFEAGYEEVTRQASRGTNNPDSVARVLRAQSIEQTARLESKLGWLATTAAACPFIGLFGTVWGIIDAFHGLGTEGAATLTAVAPGISEALVTTAAGLFAAIPALIAYNAFSHQIREFGIGAEQFSLEFSNSAEQPAAGGTVYSAG